MTTWKLLWNLAGPARRTAAAGALLRAGQALCLGAGFIAAILVTSRVVAGQGITSADTRNIVLLCVGSLAGQLLCGFCAARCSWRASSDAVAGIRTALLDHLQRVPAAAQEQPQELIALFGADLRAVKVWLGETLPRLVQAVTLPVVMLLGVTIADPLIGLAFGLSMVAAIPAAIWSGKRIGELEGQRQQSRAAAIARMIDTTQALPALVTLGTRAAAAEYFHRAVEDYRDHTVALVHRLLLPTVLTCLVLLLGAPLVMKSLASRSIPNEEYLLAAAVLILVLSAYQPLVQAAGLLESCRECAASIHRVQGYLNDEVSATAVDFRSPTMEPCDPKSLSL